MKNMKQNLFEGIKGQMVRTMGAVAMKSGEVTMETSCALMFHEPKIPAELLKKYSCEQ